MAAWGSGEETGLITAGESASVALQFMMDFKEQTVSLVLNIQHEESREFAFFMSQL